MQRLKFVTILFVIMTGCRTIDEKGANITNNTIGQISAESHYGNIKYKAQKPNYCIVEKYKKKRDIC
ncbi:MAG: hypothetical protein U9O87_04790 [Verrucomicrobiota bacterium]|nr:hypothetical protein [Verrucomicrobiota bacterium]